jgi:hypothetical protein
LNRRLAASGSGDIQSSALLDWPAAKTEGLIVKPTVGVVCASTTENRTGNNISNDARIKDAAVFANVDVIITYLLLKALQQSVSRATTLATFRSVTSGDCAVGVI